MRLLKYLLHKILHFYIDPEGKKGFLRAVEMMRAKRIKNYYIVGLTVLLILMPVFSYADCFCSKAECKDILAHQIVDVVLTWRYYDRALTVDPEYGMFGLKRLEEIEYPFPETKEIIKLIKLLDKYEEYP